VLKAAFRGAAATVIGQMTDHPLHMDYQRILQSGIKPNRTRLTRARRVAAIVPSMWKHKPQAQSGVHAENGSRVSSHQLSGLLDATGRPH